MKSGFRPIRRNSRYRSPVTFRTLRYEELEAAYHIVKQSVERLLANQLPAWLVPYDTYEQQQVKGENCGLFLEQRLGAVVTLSTAYRPQDWAEYLPETDFVWLGTLCVADEFRGQGTGQLALTQAEAFLQRQRKLVIWLDCYYGNGFLPAYYQANGYTWTKRKELVFADGSLHDSVLMTKNLSVSSTEAAPLCLPGRHTPAAKRSRTGTGEPDQRFMDRPQVQS